MYKVRQKAAEAQQINNLTKISIPECDFAQNIFYGDRDNSQISGWKFITEWLMYIYNFDYIISGNNNESMLEEIEHLAERSSTDCPKFFIYMMKKNDQQVWNILQIKKNKENFNILYKCKLDEELQESLQNRLKIKKEQFQKAALFSGCEHKDAGIEVICSVIQMLKLVKSSNFFDEFTEEKFKSQDDLKILLYSLLKNYLINFIKQLPEEKEFTEFKSKFKKFTESLPEASEELSNYTDLLTKTFKNTNQSIDYDNLDENDPIFKELETKRKAVLQRYKSFTDSYANDTEFSVDESRSTQEANGFLPNISRKFTEKLDIFFKIYNFIYACLPKYDLCFTQDLTSIDSLIKNRVYFSKVENGLKYKLINTNGQKVEDKLTVDVTESNNEFLYSKEAEILNELSKKSYIYSYYSFWCSILTKLCQTLEINNKTIQLFLIKPQTNIVIEKQLKEEDEEDYAISELPSISSYDSYENEEDILSFDEITNKMSQENDSQLWLQECHQRIQECFEVKKNSTKPIKDWSEKDIKQWSIANKSKLTTTEEDKICEAIAVLDRANQLATGGHRLRDTQKIAILMFLKANEDKGHISQIKTGEGKTTIISFIAAIKVFQGKQVDVITSNGVLATEGVKDKSIFYRLLGITVAHNNPEEGYTQDARTCYGSDIVYGSINNFQFDYLRDSFERLETLGKRKIENNWVILDEIDSLLIDQGGHIAKISGPFPGMENLRYIYINIWTALTEAEEEATRQITEKLKIKAEKLNEKLTTSLSEEEQNRIEYENQIEYKKEEDRLQENFFEEIKNKIKNKEKQIKQEVLKLMVRHLHDYIEKHFGDWIEYAIAAKYQYQEDHHYKIVTRGEECLLVPVDNTNTGVSLNNTILSNGLHQFLQLKHNLCLTYESLTSSFVSNLGYISKYGNKILGLTGTLGSEAERELLALSYNVHFSILPTYKEKKFEEFPVKVSNDIQFINDVARSALGELIRKDLSNNKVPRAVLIICESIRDAKDIEKEINKEIEYTGIDANIIKYIDEADSGATEKKLEPKDIVIATNIAGRGTDFKTSENLEKNGGLHVIVSFLPCNQRVEEQAFGRTARQGNYGTGQIITRNSNLNTLYTSGNSRDLKKQRDLSERIRLEDIKQNKIDELKFMDRLFQKFSDLYGKIKIKHKRDEDAIKWVYVLKDLKEKWAFWLDQQNYSKNFLQLKKIYQEQVGIDLVNNEFSKFEQDQVVQSIIKGEIHHNPFYSVCLAERYLETFGIRQQYEKKLGLMGYEKAKKELENAIHISGENSEFLYSAYIKLFEVAIESSHQLLQRFRDAVAKVLFIGYAYDTHNNDYKKDALEYLKKAKNSLKIECEYLGNLLFEGKLDPIITVGSASNTVNLNPINYWYSDDDMNNLGMTLKDFGVNFDKEFKGRLTIDIIPELPKKEQLTENPIYICFNIGGKVNSAGGVHWVAIIILKYQDKVYVFYKDSKGDYEDSFKEIKAKFLEHYKDIKFIRHENIEQADDSSCGPMTINNLEIIAKAIKKGGIQSFIDSFTKLQFTSQEQVTAIREKHNHKLTNNTKQNTNLLLKHLMARYTCLGTYLGNINSLIIQINGNADIISDIQELINKITNNEQIKNKLQTLIKSESIKTKKEEIKKELEKIDLDSSTSDMSNHLIQQINNNTQIKKEIESLIEQTVDDEIKEAVIIGTKVPRYLSKLSSSLEHEKTIKGSITDQEIDELEYTGLNSIYQLKEIHDVPQEMIISAQGQIGGGLALLGTGYLFPPSLAILGPISGTLISEGITDIVTELINQGETGFNAKEYIKSKAISYGISLVTMGLSAIASSEKILNKAANACKTLANKLRLVKGHFAKVCNWVAMNLDKLVDYFEFAIDKIKMANKSIDAQREMLVGLKDKTSSFHKTKNHASYIKTLKQYQQLQKLQKTVEAMSYSKTVINISKTAAIGTLKGAAISVCVEKLVTANINRMMASTELKDYISKKVTGKVKEIINKAIDTLNGIEQEYLEKSCKELFKISLGEDVLHVFKEISMGVLRHCNNWKVQLSILAFDTIISAKDIYILTDKVCNKFLQNVEKLKTSITDTKQNDYEDVVNILSNQISEIIYTNLVSMTGKIATTVPTILYKAYNEYQENKLDQKAIDDMDDRITEIYDADQEATEMDGNCVHEALSEMLGLNTEQLADATGLAASQEGASIEDLRKMYAEIGISGIEEHSIDADLKTVFIEKKSDRGVVCFIGNNGNHAVSCYLKNNELKVMDNGHVTTLKEYVQKYNFNEAKILVGDNCSTNNLPAIHKQIRINRIEKATHPINFVGKDDGEKYKGANGSVKLRNDENVSLEFQLLIDGRIVGSGMLQPGEASLSMDQGWRDWLPWNATQSPVEVVFKRKNSSKWSSRRKLGYYGNGDDVLYSFNDQKWQAVSRDPNPFGMALENLFGIGGEGGILQEAQDGHIHAKAALQNNNVGRTSRSSAAKGAAKQDSQPDSAGVPRNRVSSIPRVKLGADGSVEQVDWSPNGLPIRGRGGDELLLRKGKMYDVKPEPWRQKLIDDGDAIDNHPPPAEKRPVKKSGDGASPVNDNNDKEYPSQRAAVRDLKRRSGVPSDARPVKVDVSKVRSSNKKNAGDDYYLEKVFRTHNPQAVGSDGVVIQHHKGHDKADKASGAAKDHIHARPVNIESFKAGNNGPVVSGTPSHGIVPNGSVPLCDKYGKRKEVVKMMSAKDDSITLYPVQRDHNHKKDASGNVYKHGVCLPDKQAALFFSRQAQRSSAAMPAQQRPAPGSHTPRAHSSHTPRRPHTPSRKHSSHTPRRTHTPRPRYNG